MGKRLLQQRRGRSPRFTAKGIKSKGDIRHPSDAQLTQGFDVVDIIHCPAHSAPLAVLQHVTGGNHEFVFAPDGISVGDLVNSDAESLPLGGVFTLSKIPEGASVHNVERRPGDGGKMVRGSGMVAKVLTKSEVSVKLQLPSKKTKDFHPDCRAALGVVAGGGRPDKPMLKAGKNHHAKRARRKLNSIVCGISMNAVSHPFGSKNSHIKGRPTQAARNDPPGRKVGKIAPSRTGRKKRK
jgi:large subunit ribosomal protein L2